MARDFFVIDFNCAIHSNLELTNIPIYCSKKICRLPVLKKNEQNCINIGETP